MANMSDMQVNIRVNWIDYPWLRKALLDWNEEGYTSADIANKLMESYPAYFVVKPTADAVRGAIRRSKEALEDIKGTTEPEQIQDPRVGDFIGLRTGYVDIEATNLGAMFGHVLCTSFADEFGRVETLRIDDARFAGKNIIDDGPLVAGIRDKLETYDVVVGHNFRLYDKAFLNARLVRAGERPIRSDLMIIDSLYLVGGQNMRLGSRRLESVAKFLELPVQKTPLDGQTWQLAGAGDKEALDSVVEHCEHDVLVERLAFARIKNFVSVIHR